MERQRAADGVVRRLTVADEGDLLALLAEDRGYGLFIASNLRSYGFGTANVRYWGQYDDAGALRGVMMAAGHNACLFAPPGADLRRLSATAGDDLRALMGRADLLASPAALPRWRSAQMEAHRFADLPRERWQPAARTVPAGFAVRRATPDDVPALATLYADADGFAPTPPIRLRATWHARVTHFRVFLAEDAAGAALCAAGTSAETERAAMIGAVWTAPAARGRGLATAVVAALAANLLRGGLRPHLFYLAHNDAAARVYARIGFRVTGDWRIWQR